MMSSKMEEVLVKSQLTNRDTEANVVLDIDYLSQAPDKCSGSPKMTKALSRKGSCRMERQEDNETSRKLVIKVACSQQDQLKQPSVPNKAQTGASPASSSPCVSDSLDGRPKRFGRLKIINPRRILLLFASMSSIGTMILIYFTLSISRRGS